MENVQSLPNKEVTEELRHLKAMLEEPGIGRHRHDLAEEFRGKTDVPLSWIQEWLNTDELRVMGCKYLWLAAMNACIGRDDVSLDVIEQGLRKTDHFTVDAAIEACRYRKIPFEVILYWYDSPLNTALQRAAINACIGDSEIPEWFIEQAIENPDSYVRHEALKVFEERRPIVRDFEPPIPVYVKCALGAVVVAEILPNAQVRGAPGERCFTNMVEVKDILPGQSLNRKMAIPCIGDYEGIIYHPGDQVHILGFELERGIDKETNQFNRVSFYCTLEEAKEAKTRL